jgi:hypothetical protein
LSRTIRRHQLGRLRHGLYTKPARRRDESTIPTARIRQRFSKPRSPHDELSLLSRNMCHAREREHPKCHDTIRFAALRRSRRLPGLRRRFVVSPRLDPRFRGDDTCAWKTRAYPVCGCDQNWSRRLEFNPRARFCRPAYGRSRHADKRFSDKDSNLDFRVQSATSLPAGRSEVGSRSWIRTTIADFKGLRPAFRRSGNGYGLRGWLRSSGLLIPSQADFQAFLHADGLATSRGFEPRQSPDS